MDWKGKRILGYKDDEKTAYEIGKEKGFPDPVFNPVKKWLEKSAVERTINMRISNWQSKLVEHWTGYIVHDEDGYAAVLYEGFGTYETLEEAEAYMIENDYEKVEEALKEE